MRAAAHKWARKRARASARACAAHRDDHSDNVRHNEQVPEQRGHAQKLVSACDVRRPAHAKRAQEVGHKSPLFVRPSWKVGRRLCAALRVWVGDGKCCARARARVCARARARARARA